MSYVPERGDAIWLDFDPQAGHEQAGRRPALVLSPQAYNGRIGLLLCCPITSRVKGYTFEVLLPSGYDLEGVILADQIKSMDWRTRRATFIAKLPTLTVNHVHAKLKTLLDFS